MFKSKLFEALNTMFEAQNDLIFLKDFAKQVKAARKLSEAEAKKITKQFFGYLELCGIGTIVKTEFGKRFDIKTHEENIVSVSTKDKFDVAAQEYFDELVEALCATFRISLNDRHVDFENLAGINFGEQRDLLIQASKVLIGVDIIPTHLALIRNSNSIDEVAKILLHCAIMPIA